MKVINGLVLTGAEAIIRAIKIVGSERALAKLIGVDRQKLRYWRLNAVLPCDMAIKICVATNGQVTLAELRPDLKGVMFEYETIRKQMQ